MPNKELSTRIILRNDTQANWTANNQILMKGEYGIETDTNRYKRGNGIDTWDNLKYFSDVDSADYILLKQVIKLLQDDAFGKVNDVKVNGESIVKDKVANFNLGVLIISDSSVEYGTEENFANNITLHKIAKTGDYLDLKNRPNVVDNLNSTSGQDLLSAGQGNALYNMIKNIQKSKSFATYQEMVAALNSYDKTVFYEGLNVWIATLNVPDFWIYSVEEDSVEYNYTSDADLITDINENGIIQIGYYKLAKLETQKVDLSDYYTKTQVNEFISGLDNRLKNIEEDGTILRSTDVLILNGGNSEV